MASRALWEVSRRSGTQQALTAQEEFELSLISSSEYPMNLPPDFGSVCG